MGRGYIVEECVETYLTNLTAAAGSCETGLFIGQCSTQRDFVLLAVQTPSRDGDSGPESQKAASSLDCIDEKWVAEHARQVSRMLPGGLSVLGLFLITPPQLSKEAQNILKKLAFAVDKSVSKSRLWELSEDDVTDHVALHICSKTRKVTCKTFDVKDLKCSAKPADWKYQCGVSASWPMISCSVQIDLQIPVTSEDMDQCIKNGLRKWAKQIGGALCLINGRAVSDESDFLSGPKRNPKTSPQPTLLAQLIVSEDADADQSCSAVVQECSGALCFRGSVYCRAYIHTNKPKNRYAAQALKRDVVNTISNRLEMLLEDLQMNEGGLVSGQQNLPLRVFAPLTSSSLSVCDYMFQDESSADVAERLNEMLSCDLSERDIDTSMETHIRCTVMAEKNVCGEEASHAMFSQSSPESMSTHSVTQYAGVAVAVGIALLATATSLLYLTE